MSEESLAKARAIIEEFRVQVIPKTSSEVPATVLSLIKQLLKTHNLAAEALFGGSWAKNTYLEGDHDIDIFIRFDSSGLQNDEDISDLTGLVLASMAPVQRIHGSRDYFQFTKEGFDFEIVPVMKIHVAREAVNSTDASPFHVFHVQEALHKNTLLASDIRLAKLFCKTARVYGAESYLNGFSGHVLDNLLIHYGDLLSFFLAVKEWDIDGQVFIDAQGLVTDAKHLNEAKKMGPLVLIDPVQSDRNAAAALGREKYTLFIKAVQTFLEQPDESYFRPKPVTKESIREEYTGKKLFMYELLTGKGSKDVAGTKLLKCHEYMLRRAQEEGFVISKEGFDFDGKRALCYFVVEENELSLCAKMIGPPKTQEIDAERFREKHKEHDVCETSEGKLSALVPRKYRKMNDFLEGELENVYITERSTGTRIL